MPQEPAQLADKNEYTLSYATASCNCAIMLGSVIVSTLLGISLMLGCFVSRLGLPQLCMQVLNGCQPLSRAHAAILRATQQYNRHKRWEVFIRARHMTGMSAVEIHTILYMRRP
jgi:hypothetical protein